MCGTGRRRKWEPHAEALAALESLPYPTTRQERWKYTRVTRLLDIEPQATTSGPLPEPVLAGLDAHVLTFVAGQYVDGEILDEGPDGCFVGPRSVALERYPNRIPAHPTDGFATTEWFAALQSAAPQDGGCVIVPEPVKSLPRPVLAAPPHAQWNRRACRATTGPHPHRKQRRCRSHPLVGQRQCTVSGTCSMPPSQPTVGDGASLSPSKSYKTNPDRIAPYGPPSFHPRLQQQADPSHCHSQCAHWLRNDLHIVQDGTHADSTFHGCYLPNGQTVCRPPHAGLTTPIQTASSNELYKGLAADRQFDRRIQRQNHGPQGCPAHRSLPKQLATFFWGSRRLYVFAKPELEIYADDVRCSHGCTTGQFDKRGLVLFALTGHDRNSGTQPPRASFPRRSPQRLSVQEIRDHVHAVFSRQPGLELMEPQRLDRLLVDRGLVAQAGHALNV